MAVLMPVKVALGISGRSRAPDSPVERHLFAFHFALQRSDDWRFWGGDRFDELFMKKERNADTEIMMTAILHSCCCQNASQTMSTEPPSSLMAAILITATIAMISERHNEIATPNFCWAFIRVLRSMIIGIETSNPSLTMSSEVVIPVSRSTL